MSCEWYLSIGIGKDLGHMQDKLKASDSCCEWCRFIAEVLLGYNRQAAHVSRVHSQRDFGARTNQVSSGSGNKCQVWALTCVYATFVVPEYVSRRTLRYWLPTSKHHQKNKCRVSGVSFVYLQTSEGALWLVSCMVLVYGALSLAVSTSMFYVIRMQAQQTLNPRCCEGLGKS